MIKSKVFEKAHEITRATVRPGDSYAVTFAAALKVAYTLRYKIRQTAEAVMIVDGHGKVIKKGCCTKRSEREFFAAVESFNAEAFQPAKPEVAKTTTSRRIVLVSQSAGLNCGKAWTCTGYNVDQHGLHPSWEGELICYAYN